MHFLLILQNLINVVLQLLLMFIGMIIAVIIKPVVAFAVHEIIRMRYADCFRGIIKLRAKTYKL